METSHFTIVAKAPNSGIGAPGRDGGRETAPPIGVALMMLRSMLEERFKLVTHKEDRPTTVYALTAPKGEAKLKKPGSSDRAGCKPDPGAIPTSASGTPMLAVTCLNTTMEDLVKNLRQFAGPALDHPVIDATGLQGGWNFTLIFTPPGPALPANAPAGGAAAASDPGGITIFEAFDKQLGLKLEKGTHSLSVIVVDHAEEKPID
jgi:uncharacterized protein (TIGR03435 family)